MTESNNLFTTDVLIIGGSIAALSAANKAVDKGVDVLIADKSTAGFSGQVPLAGGHFACVPPDKVEMRFKYFTENGEFLNDQEFTEAFVKATYPAIEEMSSWTPFYQSFPRKSDDTLMLNAPMGVSITNPRRDLQYPMMLRRVLDKGGKVLNKVYIADLVMRDGRVVGAVGFHYQTGQLYVIQAKAVILACGGCMFKSRPLWHVNCGEGVAMAYKAGAEIRNAEFGNMFSVTNKYTLDDGGFTFELTERFCENTLGENIEDKYPQIQRAPNFRAIQAWVKEIEDGRGPISVDLTKHLEIIKTGGYERWGDQNIDFLNKMKRLGLDPSKQKIEFAIAPEFHEGPIRVNLKSQTTIPGVYAAGDILWHGSAWYGAVDWQRGNPMSLALVTGIWAGAAAGETVSSTPKPKISKAEIEELKKDIFAPLGKKSGYDPYNAIKDVQEVTFKIKNSVIKSQDRLEGALSKIEDIKAKLPTLMAKDSHELVRCHEAKAMVTCAELLYRASLMRTETRGSNIREDYPARDDKNWLKWIIIKKEDDKMNLWTEPVPIDKYKIKPS
jgi:succinate dehydrogenase/fumarate reductase flavoprotein subunit